MNTNENSHEPLVERALVGFDLAAEHHLANCAPCQSEREQVADALRNFGAAKRQYANRPESFWEQQAARIRAARSERLQRSGVALALAPGLAVLLLVGIALVRHEPSPRPVTVAVFPGQSDASDHELLLEVERAVESDTPFSLEPATLMVEESDNRVPVNSTNSSKEPRSHEN
jgi:hypothetical protein